MESTDIDAAKIFVGGLDWDTSIDSLRVYFESYGKVVDCSIKTDRNTGRSRGFGFVQFTETSAVDEVLNVRNHTLDGKVIDPKRVKVKETLEALKKIFVGGLDPLLSEDAIREYFSKFGVIDELDLPYDRNTNERRRFCFIRFTSNDPVTKACKINQHTIAGKVVEVKPALSKTELAALSSPMFNSPFAGAPYPGANYLPRPPRGSFDNRWPAPHGLHTSMHSAYDTPPLPGNGYRPNAYGAPRYPASSEPGFYSRLTASGGQSTSRPAAFGNGYRDSYGQNGSFSNIPAYPAGAMQQVNGNRQVGSGYRAPPMNATYRLIVTPPSFEPSSRGGNAANMARPTAASVAMQDRGGGRVPGANIRYQPYPSS